MADTYISMPKGDMDDGVKVWFNELNRGERLRRTVEPRWKLNEKFEDMSQWAGETSDFSEGEFDQVTINKVGSYCRTYRARIGWNDPRAKLTPKTADGYEEIVVPVVGPDGTPKLDPQTGKAEVRSVVKAKVREALINDIMSAPLAGTQAVNSRLVKAGLLAYGLLKSGYEPTFSTPPEIEGEQKIGLNDDGTLDLDAYAKNPVSGLLEEDDNERLIRRDSVPIYEDFFIKWVPYRNMLIDPDGGSDWADHRWVAEEWVRPLEEVKADPLFKNTKDLRQSGYRRDVENIDATDDEWQRTETDWDMGDAEVRKTEKVVRGFDIYDLVQERLVVLADGHGKYLRDIPMPLGITDHPFSDFRPNEILGKFYPRPIVTDLAPINILYNISRQMELRAMKRSTRKVFTRKDALTGDDLDQFASDEDMAIIEVDTRGHIDLNTAILPYTPPPVSDALYRNTALISADFDEVGGISEAGRGRQSGGTATEAGITESYSGDRIDFDGKVLAGTWRRAVKKLNDSLDANMTVERAVQLRGSDGQAFSGLVDRDMIAGDYDVDVDVEDMARPNTAMQNAGKTQVMQIAGQAPWMFTSDPLVRGWLEPYGGLAKDQNFIDALMEAAQFQMQILMAQAMPPGPSPESDAPTSEAQAISQQGAGVQPRNMQGAT